MNVRQRKTNAEDEKTRASKMVPRPKETNGHLGKTYLVMIVVLGSLFMGYIAIANDLKPVKMGSSALDNLAYSLNLHKPFYVVIIDAGSTGSRVLAFTFHSSLVNGDLILDRELFAEKKPGLSSFADNPEEAAKSLDELLTKAKNEIPESEWSNTPISMRATAGLRLLSERKAAAILDECQKRFESSGFLVTKNSVSIMEGKDEGIFAWFTVNFLQDRFHLDTSSDATVAALDLGGGSTQVTFAPRDSDIKQLGNHVYAINAFGRNMSIYTHSYLGMGLMAARKEILTRDTNKDKLNVDGAIEINSECINPIISQKWNYGGREYLVNGSLNPSHKIIRKKNKAEIIEDRPIVDFKKCSKIVKNYVATIKNKPVGLKNHQVNAFSYYFDRAIEVGLIDPQTGGAIVVEAFQKEAKRACEYPNADQPFMCLDLTFISVLLVDGFDLEPKTKLFLYKKINNHELSWALGAAFSLLEKDF